MIRKLLATTAIATILATGAVAQTGTAPATEAPTAAPVQQETRMEIRAEGHLATDLIGKTVYNGAHDDAENIGEVNDLVLSQDGEVDAIVVGVGGFLGIGQKEVALEYDTVEWAERDGERWLVVETTADALKAQEAFDRSAFRPMPADAEVAETKPATKDDLANAPAAAPADGEASEELASDDMKKREAAEDATTEMTQNNTGERVVDPGTDETRTAAIDRNTLQEMPADQLRAENFVGTTVYGANEENIGEIGDVILSQDGKVDAVIIDVGGFLGIGEKEVAVGMDNLVFLTDGDGSLYLYTEFTEEELERQPAYDEASYAEQRDEMRMQVR